jgi:hypothetical protein
MRAIGAILNGNTESDKDSVRGLKRTRGDRVPIPNSLSNFARHEGLTLEQTRCLLGMRLEIKAHRSNSKSDDLEDFDWKRFYRAVKQYLK